MFAWHLPQASAPMRGEPWGVWHVRHSPRCAPLVLILWHPAQAPIAVAALNVCGWWHDAQLVCGAMPAAATGPACCGWQLLQREDAPLGAWSVWHVGQPPLCPPLPLAASAVA